MTVERLGLGLAIAALRSGAALTALAIGSLAAEATLAGRGLALLATALLWSAVQAGIEGVARRLIGSLPGTLRLLAALGSLALGAALLAESGWGSLPGGVVPRLVAALILVVSWRALDHLHWRTAERRLLEREARFGQELDRGRRWLLGEWRAARAAAAESRTLAEREAAWVEELEQTVERLEADAAAGRAAQVSGGDPLPRAETVDFSYTPVAAARPDYRYAPTSFDFAPDLSIVTPFYNPGAPFAATARSVFSQTLQRWEWIVVDDASTDAASLAALERARAADPRVRVIRQPKNGGPGAARNRGFAAARAAYVLQLDADDLLEPTAAEKWLWHLHTHPEHAFVNGHTLCFGASEGVWNLGFEQGGGFLERNFVGGRGMLRRAVHERVGGYDAELPLALEDWDFWLRCAAAGFWGTTLDEALDWQRRRGSDMEQWPDWDGGERQAAAKSRMHARYPELVAHGVPTPESRWPQPYEPVRFDAPSANPLAGAGRRLLLVVDWLALGGTDRFCLDLLDQLSARDWQVSVVSTLDHADPWRWEYLRRTPDVFMLHRFLRAADYAAFLRYLIDSRQHDVVLISHSEHAYQLLPALRAWCPQPAYVDFLHILEPGWKSGGYPRMSTLYRSQLDLTISNTEDLRDWMIANGSEPERIAVARTAIDAGRYRPDERLRRAERARLGLDDQTPVVLFAGRLCEQKRPLVVARTLERLAARGVAFNALVAGDGEERGVFESYLDEHGLRDRVWMLGPVAAAGMRGLMAASDIFFLPSEREGIAVTIYEAMASGLPVVATEVGGQHELVIEGSGFLLPAGEDEAAIERFADALERLLASRDLRREVGRAARGRVLDGFTIETMGERMVQLLERATELRDRAPRTPVQTDLAERLGEQAVEFMRLNELCDQLWTERQRHLAVAGEVTASEPEAVPPGAVPAAAEEHAVGSRTEPRGVGPRAFAALKRLAEPVYVWGLRNGWSWLVPLKERVKQGLGARREPGRRE